MTVETIHSITSFIAAHPHWIGFAVFLATALESMAFIGSIFPGMSMVIALSGVAASLGIDVWILVLWCALGAIVGDGASYWLGNRFGDRLPFIWPFRTRPELLERGAEFFQRNGGKSIIVGRFLPVTRAVVPIAAGMLGMSPIRFCLANILSAMGWALINVVPAAGVGLAFTVINQSSSRIAAIFGLFAAIFLLALLAGQGTARFILPGLDALFSWLAGRLRNRPWRAARVAALVFGSAPRSATANAVWVLMALGAALAFAKILEDIITDDPLVRMDVALNSLIQGFRSPVGDSVMVALTSMGDMMVVLWTFAALVGGLLISRAWRTSGITLLVLSATAVFVPLLKWTLHKPRPIDLYSGAEAFSFPSGHAAFAAVLWGMIAVISSRGLARKTQATIWAAAFTLSMMIGLSRVYLSAHWPSDVMGGLLFGWALAALFGLFTERIREPIIHPALLGLSALVALIVAWGFHVTASFDENLARYAPREQVISISLAEWIESGWKTVPPARIDLKGEYEEPLAFQVTGPPTEVEAALQAAGWTRNPTMAWRQASQFFAGSKDLASLAPLPLLHNGVSPLLTMVATSSAEGQRDVFRLWRSGVEIGDMPGRPMLLVGSVTRERVSHPFDGINLLHDRPAPPSRIQRIVASLASMQGFCLFPPPSDPERLAPWLIVPRGENSCPTDGKTNKKSPGNEL